MDEDARLEDDGVDQATSEVIRRTFDWSTTNPSTGVVEAVAADLGEDPLSVEPLARRVDPGALDALLAGGTEATDESAVTVSFTFADRHVTADATGLVVVRPVDLG
jgi:hypothetical protein